MQGEQEGGGVGVVGMWLGIELVGKESVCIKCCITPTYNFIEMPWQALITTEESKSLFIILKFISLLCKT